MIENSSSERQITFRVRVFLMISWQGSSRQETGKRMIWVLMAHGQVGLLESAQHPHSLAKTWYNCYLQAGVIVTDLTDLL